MREINVFLFGNMWKIEKYELPLFPHEENATKQAPEGHDLK
jgi:hypothetical protein